MAWGAAVLTTAGLVFVASNPFLYRDPIGRSWLLLQNRRVEMAAQAAFQPERAPGALIDRAALVWERSLFHETWGNSYAGWPIEAVLAAAGAAWLLSRIARRPTAPDLLLGLWIACVVGGVTWGLGFRLQHYFVPTTTMATLLAGLGGGLVGELVARGVAWSRATVTGRAGALAAGAPKP